MGCRGGDGVSRKFEAAIAARLVDSAAGVRRAAAEAIGALGVHAISAYSESLQVLASCWHWMIPL